MDLLILFSFCFLKELTSSSGMPSTLNFSHGTSKVWSVFMLVIVHSMWCIGIGRSMIFHSAEFRMRGSSGPEVIAI
jgi:hypothetical protein